LPTSYIRVAVHFVWATWDRTPSIRPEWEERLYAAIAAIGKQKNCPVYAVNGTTDHLHVLARLDANTSLAALVQQMKGSTSHLINQAFAPSEPFRWQGAYAAFSVDKENIDRVRAYVLNQKAHHAADTSLPDWERTQT
jgi:putative transposase